MNHEAMIAKSRKLFALRWGVFLSAACLAMLFLSSRPHGDTWLGIVFSGIAFAVALSINTVLNVIRRRLNRVLAASLTVPEIRQLVRVHGRPGAMRMWSGLSDILAHCLPRIKTRGDLSEAEWRIVNAGYAEPFLRYSRETVRALNRASVYEIVDWYRDAGGAPFLPGSLGSQTLAKFRKLTPDERDSLHAFAPETPDVWTASDFVSVAKQLPVGNLFLAGFGVVIACAIASCIASRSFYLISSLTIPLMIVASAQTRIAKQPLKIVACSTPDVVALLIQQHLLARGAWQKTILRRAVRLALTASPDISRLAPEEWRHLLGMLLSSRKAERELLLRILMENAPSSLLPAIQEESSRWLASKTRGAPQKIRDLTEIRLSVLRRIGSESPSAITPEVP